jgi:hypothetical protein
VGQWLRAALLNQRQLGDQLRHTLNGGKAGWNYDEPGVVEAVCAVAARKLFPAGVDAQAIAAFASDVRSRVHNTTPPGQLETEAVVRFVLGDPDVVMSHVPNSELFHAQVVVAAGACLKLGLDEAAIDQMIVEGERIALEQGWHPPLAR